MEIQGLGIKDHRLFYPATQRNKSCIGEVLSKLLPETGSVLEIASGSGEHGVTFQQRFPSINWQTSDPDPLCRKSITAWINYLDLKEKMPQPLNLDVGERPWPLSTKFISSLKAIVCINMLHVSHWSNTSQLFEEAQKILKKDNLVIFYGPFKINDSHTSHSNMLFDQALKDQDSSWGIRDLTKVKSIATKNGFSSPGIFKMPSNNFLTTFSKNNSSIS